MITGFQNGLQRNDDLYTIAAGFRDLSGLKRQASHDQMGDASLDRIRPSPVIVPITYPIDWQTFCGHFDSRRTGRRYPRRCCADFP